MTDSELKARLLKSGRRVLAGALAIAGIGGVFGYYVMPLLAAPPGSPYAAGETLDPSCAPGDPNCTVVPAAPSTVPYLALSSSSALSGERVLTAGSNMAFADAGANGTLTLNVTSSPTFTGFVTIATTSPPRAPIFIEYGHAVNSSYNQNIHSLSAATTSANIATLRGIFNQVYTEGSGEVTTAIGITNEVDIASNVTTTNAYGSFNVLQHFGSGTIGSAYGAYSRYNNGFGGGVTTNYYGNHVSLSNSGSTITNTYGLYVDDITSGTQTNQAFGVYVSDANARNYFAGRVGIGTSTPGQELHVIGDIRLDLNGSPTINALCHSAAGTTDQDIVDCSGAPSDVAEWYETTGDSEPGDLVATTPEAFAYREPRFDPRTGLATGETLVTRTAVLRKASRDDADSVIGVISTSPYQVLGEAMLSDGARHPQPVALAGRVPVKVSLENGAIAAGDLLALSASVPGKAAKAVEPGMVIGTALSAADRCGGGCTVTVFVQPTFSLGSPADDGHDGLGAFARTMRHALRELGVMIVDGVARLREIVADRLVTRELCIEDVCIDKAQLKEILERDAVNPSQPAADDTDAAQVVTEDPAPGTGILTDEAGAIGEEAVAEEADAGSPSDAGGDAGDPASAPTGAAE